MKQYGIEETIADEVADGYHNAALDEKTKSLLAFAEKLTRNAYTSQSSFDSYAPMSMRSD